MINPFKFIGKVPEQVRRLILILILVIVGLLTARYYFIPETFWKIWALQE